MLELVYREGDQEKVFALKQDVTTIGRSPDADLVLNEQSVSRLHARLTVRDGEVTIRDLSSRNGTHFNDERVAEARLAPGDKVVLGSRTLELRERTSATDRVRLDEGASVPEASRTVIRPALELEQLFDPGRGDRIVRMVTQVAKALISEEGLDGLLDKIMDLVLENIPSSRGVLGLYEDGELVPRVLKHSPTSRQDSVMVIPRSIPRRVRDEKVAILVKDALSDERIDTTQSLIRQGMRSAMCVPLWHKDTVIGIIYLEQLWAGEFAAADLDLLTAFANYSAVAIDRQRLTAKVEEEQAIRARLTRYHSPSVVETILKGGGALDALEMQECEVSVSFTDLVGFTTMSESLEPRDVRLTLNAFFTTLTDCVFAHEGTLDKYIGDCIMAVFGAPIPHPDHAVKAVRAALDMHRALDKLNAERSHLPPIQLRTGINSGRVVAGDIGSPKRKDYTVLGDPVNVASRLESEVAQPGWIVIGESTYAAVKGLFECEPLGSRAVKGRAREIEAYRVRLQA